MAAVVQITSRLEEDGAWNVLHRLSKIASTGKGNTKYKVWQEGYRPITLYSRRFFLQKLNYIHNNPVRKGLVQSPEEWRFSSAEEYLTGVAGIIETDRLVL